jgi:molybdenum cofactor biosynthesis protein MoaC
LDFTHFNDNGRAWMVDVGAKNDTERSAIAQARVRMQPATLEAIKCGGIKKGDVLGVAQVAGIMAAKQTANLIPMCHPLMLSAVNILFEMDEENSSITIQCQVKTTGKTGVEMEAISGAGIAAITIYDMSKAIDRWMEITDLKLLEKDGGKNGHLVRKT